MNYGVTYSQMQENDVNLELLYDLLANILYMAEKSQSGWDAAWLPTSLLKRSRAVSDHMVDRVNSIVKSIFGREPSWWEKMTRPDDDDDPFGNATKKEPKGIERRLADERIGQCVQRLHRENPSIEKYATAQDHPGLTYDPEVLPLETRVMSCEVYNRSVAQETRATRHRYETERAVQAKRSDLLVPLVQQKEVAVPPANFSKPQAQ